MLDLLEIAQKGDDEEMRGVRKPFKELPYLKALDPPVISQHRSSFSIKNRIIRGRRTSMFEDLRCGNMLDYKIKQISGLEVIGEQRLETCGSS